MATTLTINGSAELGAARDNASFSFGGQRLDAPGTVSTFSEFVPDGDKLRLKIAVSEPAGSLVARLAEIPRLPPSKSVLNVTGDGTLDACAATLKARAGGEDASAQGGARITRDGASQRVSLDLSAKIAELLPKKTPRLCAVN